MLSRSLLLLPCLALVAGIPTGLQLQTPQNAPPERDRLHEVEASEAGPIQLTAVTRRTYEAPDADQGVAADARHVYVVDNHVIAKYEIASGRLAGRWDGTAAGPIRHLNSCLAEASRLWCANSNYPATPMGSSIEIFDTETLQPAESHSLGMMDEGSLTWFDRYRGGWMAAFAHYDGNGGLEFKDHRFSSVVTFDNEWRRTGGWLFPASVLDRMAPYASSGGAIGPDGWLYLLGHDRPEMYVLGRPRMGPTLVHLATVALEAEGQAFSWAQDGTRTVFAVDRRKGLVRAIEIPRVAVDAGALPFRE
ncbi:MAG: hypothetical protein AB7I50_00010 [Vicinamibacterales bacterium]